MEYDLNQDITLNSKIWILVQLEPTQPDPTLKKEGSSYQLYMITN